MRAVARHCACGHARAVPTAAGCDLLACARVVIPELRTERLLPGLEVGWLLDREWWGRGLATEAGRAAIDYAFRALGAERVISLIRPENHPSIRVAQRLGEAYQGTVEVVGAHASVYGLRRFGSRG